jgi:chromate transport protein ChrA
MKAKPRKNNIYKVTIEIAGWYGAAAVLLAYTLVSFNIISSHSWTYQLLNFTGAVGVLIISYMKRAKQPALLNFVWAVIALVALIQLAVE